MNLQPAAPAFARRATTTSLEASFQGDLYAAYPDSIGGVILARLTDGWATYLPKGPEARSFYDAVYTAIDGREDHDSEGDAFDRAAVEYEGFMSRPADMRGRPGPDGDFWLWDVSARVAA